jgi:protein phosphatase
MGSRAVVVLCRDPEAARRRFGATTGETGVCYTRTGRRFFTDEALERGLLDELVKAASDAGLWRELDTDWLCLDCELMPWSLKAQELLRQQYAPVGAAAVAALGFASRVVEGSTNRAIDLEPLAAELRDRLDLVERYTRAYRGYCWPIGSLADLRIAPFHLLASEGAVHAGQDHGWHLGMAGRLADAGDGVVLRTAHREVDLASEASRAEAVAWWEEITGRGAEGMVVKPWEFLARGRKGLAQPALKCRGRDSLRIIYGPEYTLSGNLERLRKRGLSRKRSLALRELALGLEALHRFVEREPLRRVHECVFGVLALESEPVDPRL